MLLAEATSLRGRGADVDVVLRAAVPVSVLGPVKGLTAGRLAVLLFAVGVGVGASACFISAFWAGACATALLAAAGAHSTCDKTR